MKEQEDSETLRKKLFSYASDGFFKKPIVKVIIGAGILYGALYLSKYVMNRTADAIRAFKNLRGAVRER